MNAIEDLFEIDHKTKSIRFLTLFDVGAPAPAEPVIAKVDPFRQPNAPGNLAPVESLEEVCERADRAVALTDALFAE